MQKTGHSKKAVGIYVIIFLAVQLSCNLIYLPGPDALSGIAVILYIVGQILSLLAIPVLSVCLFLMIVQWVKKQKILSPKTWILPFSFCFSLLFTQEKLRTFARNYAIENAQPFIESLAAYQSQQGFYPTDLSANKMLLPNDGIIGIAEYQYEGTPQHFELSFQLPVIFFFNFETVLFDAKMQHTSEGKLKQLYDTEYPNWKYYLFD